MSVARIVLRPLRPLGYIQRSTSRHIFTYIPSPLRPAGSLRVVQNSSTCEISSTRLYSTEAQAAPEPQRDLTDGERKVYDKLMEELQPTKLEVQDISGGCGSMYGVDIVSPKFQGLTVIKQHKLVNQVLAEDIKGWHGMQLKTKAA